MVQRICPYCRCEDSCGREAFDSRPYSYFGPTPTEVTLLCSNSTAVTGLFSMWIVRI
jgi:hypothetical protein